MSEEKSSNKYKVQVLESERGRGQKYENWYFDTMEEAVQAYSQFQPKAGPVPDYYIIATNIYALDDNNEWHSIVVTHGWIPTHGS